MSSGPVMKLCNVERTYYIGSGPVHALRGIDLELPDNKMTIIKGPSGSGKTTILNIMGGLDHPNQGTVLFKDRELNSFSQRELTSWRRKQVGFVFQAFALVQTLTAFENVELPLLINRLSWKEREKKAYQALEMVGLRDRAAHRTFELSGGEQQRVGIARALVNQPSLILADEPTGEVDHETGLHLMELFIKMVKDNEITICLATHDPASMKFGDLTYEIIDGEIVNKENRDDKAVKE